MSVYFIRDDVGRVKIGFARSPERRLRCLQNATPHRLSLVLVIEGGRQTEQWLHTLFASQRISGEWFKFHPDMLSIEPPREAVVSRPFSSVLDILGGRTSVAIALGVKRETVRRWGERNSIPSWYWQKITELPAAKQYGVTAERLALMAGGSE